MSGFNKNNIWNDGINEDNMWNDGFNEDNMWKDDEFDDPSNYPWNQPSGSGSQQPNQATGNADESPNNPDGSALNSSLANSAPTPILRLPPPDGNSTYAPDHGTLSSISLVSNTFSQLPVSKHSSVFIPIPGLDISRPGVAPGPEPSFVLPPVTDPSLHNARIQQTPSQISSCVPNSTMWPQPATTSTLFEGQPSEHNYQTRNPVPHVQSTATVQDNVISEGQSSYQQHMTNPGSAPQYDDPGVMNQNWESLFQPNMLNQPSPYEAGYGQQPNCHNQQSGYVNRYSCATEAAATTMMSNPVGVASSGDSGGKCRSNKSWPESSVSLRCTPEERSLKIMRNRSKRERRKQLADNSPGKKETPYPCRKKVADRMLRDSHGRFMKMPNNEPIPQQPNRHDLGAELHDQGNLNQPLPNQAGYDEAQQMDDIIQLPGTPTAQGQISDPSDNNPDPSGPNQS